MREDTIRDIPDLWKATYDLVAQIPRGRVTTYGEVARALGDVVASRFVGLAMSKNDDIVRVPCRRVVRSDGKVGGYTGGGPEKKERLLRDEGVRVENGTVVDLQTLLFTDFETDHPLKRLRSRQLDVKRSVRTTVEDLEVTHVTGLDVAYHGERAFAASATFDLGTGQQVGSSVIEGEAFFPYVPTYLAFRELPLVAPLVRDLGERTALMYDGNGVLHPEGVGIASHAGVVFDLPAVGVAKSMLCGTRGPYLDECVRQVFLGDQLAGFELARPGRSRPVYVSAGHGIGPSQALELVRRLWEHRVPEPVRAAHILAERARKGTIHK